MWYKDFTATSFDDIPKDFVQFTDLYLIIVNQQMDIDKLLYLSVDPKSHNALYSNVCVDQENNNGVVNHIAYLFKNYNYVQAFEVMLNSKENLEYYKLLITGYNKPDNKISIRIEFYIKSSYLLKLYELSVIPLIIYKLIISKGISVDNQVKPIINNCIVNRDISIILDVKREAFSYQLANIKWMSDIENNVDNNTLTYETFNKPDKSVYYSIRDIDELLLLDNEENKMIDINSLETHKFNFYGGIIADDIGLGKTYTTVGLIKYKYTIGSLPTLIICPKRLSLQWQEEINKTCDLKCYIINTIHQFKKLDLITINNYAIIITSYEFLVNQRYTTYIKEPTNQDKFTINRYSWERIILDEGHEYVTCSRNINKIQTRTIQYLLCGLKSKYRWICSGTPFNNRLDFWETIYYLSKKGTEDSDRYISKYNIYSKNTYTNTCYQHAIDGITELIVRKNTKESVKEDVTIPEYDITTTFLNMTTTERAIYNSALDDETKKQELCNHILVSESHINILGNKPISIDETHTKMVEYYDKKISYQTKRIENIDNDLEQLDIDNDSDKITELTIKQDELSKELQDNIRKKQIFDELQEKLEEEKTCPICYEELENLYKAVTPCGHFICSDCISGIYHSKSSLKCPMCRNPFNKQDLEIISPDLVEKTNKLGTKMAKLIEMANTITDASPDNRIIIFSQWDSMLKLISNNLKNNNVNHLVLNGSYHILNSKIRKFKLDSSIRILLLSSEKAGSGLTLTEATHIILMDTMNSDPETSKTIENQAIGRAVRIGQTKKVIVNRLIMKDSIEEDYYNRVISI